MKNTSDTLIVTFDASFADETGICVSRVVNGKVDVLKMELGEQADILYHLLTKQTAKAESNAQDAISRQEVLKYFEGWKNQIKYYHPYAKNFDIPYEEAIQRINDVPPVKCVSLEKSNKWIDAEVLKKIRLDIALEVIPRSSDEYGDEAKWLNMGLRMALKVIDKYKAESEEKE